MSFLNKVFQSIPVKIPDRSGFDLSHEVLTTAKCGTVVPITHFEVLPGDTISMGSLMKVTMPPFAVPFMGRVDAELTAAFIPNRLLWQGWQSFITQNNGINTASGTANYGNLDDYTSGNTNNVPFTVPVVNALAQYSDAFYGPGSLLDYLGFKRASNQAGTAYISALPFLAYHKFCDDWIRDENNIKPFFPKVFNRYLMDSTSATDYVQVPGYQAHVSPFVSFPNINTNTPGSASSINLFSLSDRATSSQSGSGANFPWDASMALGSLRQRCWAKDYFTTATTRPQAGAAASVTFDTSGSLGNITVSTIRAANSLQRWLESNNIAGTDYGFQILSHFGVTPPDAVLNRSVLLGSVRTPVVVNSVTNNTGAQGQLSGLSFDGDTGNAIATYDSADTKNPYGNTLGSAAGFGSGADRGNLVDNFTAHEHGFIMVFFTLIPHAYYNSGWNRSLYHKHFGDFAWPEFANIGDQPILNGELVAGGSNPSGTFGYNQRYSEYKFLPDRISGLLRDGENMSVYALQRGFSSAPTLGRQFLEIPTDFLDQVTGVDADVSGFGCMVDAYFDCQALRVLPEYSLPSL